MKQHGWFALVVVAGLGFFACQQEIKNESPLLLDEELLLLEEPDATGSPPEVPMADNSRCFVCHANFEEEELSVTHARGEVGCEDCHGESDAHCGDEDNITPPDIMYPREKIASACKKCHSDALKDEEHVEVVMSAPEGKRYCTACHGKHRMNVRTRIWDKTTGELLDDDKVRMMTDDLLEKE